MQFCKNNLVYVALALASAIFQVQHCAATSASTGADDDSFNDMLVGYLTDTALCVDIPRSTQHCTRSIRDSLARFSQRLMYCTVQCCTTSHCHATDSRANIASRVQAMAFKQQRRFCSVLGSAVHSHTHTHTHTRTHTHTHTRTHTHTHHSHTHTHTHTPARTHAHTHMQHFTDQFVQAGLGNPHASEHVAMEH